MQNKSDQKIIFIYGPTGVGKTDFADRLASCLPIEIVNMDVGQFYVPLTLGTAKPDWRASAIPHHLFDILDQPRNYTVVEYRRQLLETVETIWARGHYPVVVGGSGFYLYSLFFPPVQQISDNQMELAKQSDPELLWEQLNAVDPQRAAAVGKKDPYRIQRALAIWKSSGDKPSQLVPTYRSLPGEQYIICLTRDRANLYSRINERVNVMIQAGWLEEVKRLKGTGWENFLQAKKLIGYNELLAYLTQQLPPQELESIVASIQQRTRIYAKRQLTFWRMMRKHLERERLTNPESFHVELCEVNLTTVDLDLYIKQLSHVLVNPHT